MQSKKNPKKDLSKNSSLYFAIGLCLMLFISWRVIEIKTPQTLETYELTRLIEDFDEDIPVTIENLKIPLPIKRDPVDFEIKNKFLNLIMEKSFQFGLNKIADAFQKRAEKI